MQHLVLHATVTKLKEKAVVLNKSFDEYDLSNEIKFDYLIYALGSTMPKSLQMDEKTKLLGTKPSGIDWLRHRQNVIKNSNKIVIAGGGALGIRE